MIAPPPDNYVDLNTYSLPSSNAHLHILAEAANTLTRFLGIRDLPKLRRSLLQGKYSIDQADVMILFGGTIPFGCEVAAAAWKQNPPTAATMLLMPWPSSGNPA